MSVVLSPPGAIAAIVAWSLLCGELAPHEYPTVFRWIGAWRNAQLQIAFAVAQIGKVGAHRHLTRTSPARTAGAGFQRDEASVSQDKFRADEVAHDAIPRCRKAHLARWWEHWSGDLRPPMRADEKGAAYVLVAWDGRRLLFYPDGPDIYRIAEPDR